MTFLFLFTHLHFLCFCDGCGLLELLFAILGVTAHFKSLPRNVSGAQAGGGPGPQARRLLSACLPGLGGRLFHMLSAQSLT